MKNISEHVTIYHPLIPINECHKRILGAIICFELRSAAIDFDIKNVVDAAGQLMEYSS
jgi:hypothetical protein